MAVKIALDKLIFYHRKQAKLSRKDLADLAGIGKTVVYDLENGKETVKWSTIQTVLNALNITIHFESPLMDQYEESLSKNA